MNFRKVRQLMRLVSAWPIKSCVSSLRSLGQYVRNEYGHALYVVMAAGFLLLLIIGHLLASFSAQTRVVHQKELHMRADLLLQSAVEVLAAEYFLQPSGIDKSDSGIVIGCTDRMAGARNPTLSSEAWRICLDGGEVYAIPIDLAADGDRNLQEHRTWHVAAYIPYYRQPQAEYHVELDIHPTSGQIVQWNELP
jgi:hypothetical protein